MSSKSYILFSSNLPKRPDTESSVHNPSVILTPNSVNDYFIVWCAITQWFSRMWKSYIKCIICTSSNCLLQTSLFLFSSLHFDLLNLRLAATPLPIVVTYYLYLQTYVSYTTLRSPYFGILTRNTFQFFITRSSPTNPFQENVEHIYSCPFI